MLIDNNPKIITNYHLEGVEVRIKSELKADPVGKA
jgi:hypothetical protein